jgi:hypothetical protein
LVVVVVVVVVCIEKYRLLFCLQQAYGSSVSLEFFCAN